MTNKKSKLTGIAISFKRGALNQLEDKMTYIAAGFTGVLKSNGNVAQGISETAKALGYMTIIGGTLYVVADLMVAANGETIVED